jgi:hypothetical protein
VVNMSDYTNKFSRDARNHRGDLGDSTVTLQYIAMDEIDKNLLKKIHARKRLQSIHLHSSTDVNGLGNKTIMIMNRVSSGRTGPRGEIC